MSWGENNLIRITFLIMAIGLSAGFANQAYAEGYICKGQGFRVQVYQHFDQEFDEWAPSTMIVSQKKKGAILKLFGSKIDKSYAVNGMVFEGLGNHRKTGRFVSAALWVYDKEGEEAESVDGHFARLILSLEKKKRTAKLLCEEFRK